MWETFSRHLKSWRHFDIVAAVHRNKIIFKWETEQKRTNNEIPISIVTYCHFTWRVDILQRTFLRWWYYIVFRIRHEHNCLPRSINLLTFHYNTFHTSFINLSIFKTLNIPSIFIGTNNERSLLFQVKYPSHEKLEIIKQVRRKSI